MAHTHQAKRLIAEIRNGQPHALVIIAVPSHDRRNKPLNNQELWADAALRIFSSLFGGATAFRTFKGIYRSQDSGEDLVDEPILIESYVEESTVMAVPTLRSFLEFLHRLKRETDQETVLLVINSFRFFV